TTPSVDSDAPEAETDLSLAAELDVKIGELVLPTLFLREARDIGSRLRLGLVVEDRDRLGEPNLVIEQFNRALLGAEVRRDRDDDHDDFSRRVGLLRRLHFGARK